MSFLVITVKSRLLATRLIRPSYKHYLVCLIFDEVVTSFSYAKCDCEQSLESRKFVDLILSFWIELRSNS